MVAGDTEAKAVAKTPVCNAKLREEGRDDACRRVRRAHVVMSEDLAGAIAAK